MVETANVVLFAIQSAIRFGAQARQAYVDSTRSRALVLPLPNFDAAPNIGSAITYFNQIPDVHETGPARRNQLLKKRLIEAATLSEEEQAELVVFYQEARLLDLGTAVAADGSRLESEALLSLVRVRQWARGTEPHPSVAQRLAGTFVEIGVDYFTQVPGAVDTHSRRGRAVLAFLRGLDTIEFSTTPLGDLPERLFLGTLETLAESSTLLTDDPKVQKLVTVLTSSLVTDVEARIAQLRETGGADELSEGRVRDWAEVVFRSVLDSAGRLVVENPAEMLGVSGEGEGALISNVGGALLDLVLSQPRGELDGVLTTRSLESLAKAALVTLGNHPDLLVRGDHEALRVLLSSTASQLARYDRLLDTNMLPELARLVLDKTGENLALFWPDAANDPGRNLLLKGVATTLDVLTAAPPDGSRWTPRFGRADLLTVAESVLDEFAANPGWLVDAAGEVNDNLRVALEAAVDVLRRRGDARLSTGLAARLVQSTVQAVALRQEFLHALPGEARIAVASVLDAVLEQAFSADADPRAMWVLTRRDVVEGLVAVALDELADSGIDADRITRLRDAVAALAEDLGEGRPLDLDAFADDLGELLVA